MKKNQSTGFKYRCGHERLSNSRHWYVSPLSAHCHCVYFTQELVISPSSDESEKDKLEGPGWSEGSSSKEIFPSYNITRERQEGERLI
jgi:hypothetical protein